MSSASKIEWTEQTWNPFAGCAVLSPGCTNCYAMKMAARLDAMGQPLYKGLTKPSKAGPVWRGTVRANPDALLAPLKRKKPTTYFVNSMSDLFYENFSDEMIDRVFAVMALTPQHTYQVLTKRAERMREYMTARWPGSTQFAWGCRVSGAIDDLIPVRTEASIAAKQKAVSGNPLANCWLGVSTERQKEADERISHLLQTPAAVRFISAEPLLGPIEINKIPYSINDDISEFGTPPILGIDWIIVGGESGPGARLMHPDWVRSLREQCRVAGVNFFFKQWGALRPIFDARTNDYIGSTRVGKKAAGRLLDNRTHDDMPGRVGE